MTRAQKIAPSWTFQPPPKYVPEPIKLSIEHARARALAKLIEIPILPPPEPLPGTRLKLTPPAEPAWTPEPPRPPRRVLIRPNDTAGARATLDETRAEAERVAATLGIDIYDRHMSREAIEMRRIVYRHMLGWSGNPDKKTLLAALKCGWDTLYRAQPKDTAAAKIPVLDLLPAVCKMEGVDQAWAFRRDRLSGKFGKSFSSLGSKCQLAIARGRVYARLAAMGYSRPEIAHAIIGRRSAHATVTESIRRYREDEAARGMENLSPR